MRATGAKLIKVAEAYGRDILQDTETKRIVVDFGDSTKEVETFEEAFNEAGKDQEPVRFE